MPKRQRKMYKEDITKELSELMWDLQQIAGYTSMQFSDFRDAVNVARNILIDKDNEYA